jgi:hypothetical protein
MTKESMHYFEAITFRCNQIDELAQAYLDKFEFMSNDDILERLWKIANDRFDTIGRDWNKIHLIPEWMGDFLDGWTPYAPSKNGSLYYSLGYSAISADAHLRNLLERAEGRETKKLDFPILAEKKVVNKLSGLI